MIFFFWYILLFYQPTSVKVVDEIKFKTIIPASSLVIRDHCWLTDGMSLLSSFLISFSQFNSIYSFVLFVYLFPIHHVHEIPRLLLSVVIPCRDSKRFLRHSFAIENPKERLSGRLPVIVSYILMENILFLVCLVIFSSWKHGFLYG